METLSHAKSFGYSSGNGKQSTIKGKIAKILHMYIITVRILSYPDICKLANVNTYQRQND